MIFLYEVCFPGRAGVGGETALGRIFLIRHGEVAWNRENAYIGATDLPINSEGKLQAVRLASRLEHEGISAIYSSSLMRARQTAEIIAERLGLVVRLISELREVDYGEWEGMPEAELLERYPDVYPEWRRNPADIRIPGGETFAELRDRAFPAFCRIAEVHSDENVAIVAHKSTNRVILCCLLGISMDRYRQIGQVNSALNIIERRRDGRLVVNTINEHCHSYESYDLRVDTS